MTNAYLIGSLAIFAAYWNAAVGSLAVSTGDPVTAWILGIVDVGLLLIGIKAAATIA